MDGLALRARLVVGRGLGLVLDRSGAEVVHFPGLALRALAFVLGFAGLELLARRDGGAGFGLVLRGLLVLRARGAGVGSFFAGLARRLLVPVPVFLGLALLPLPTAADLLGLARRFRGEGEDLSFGLTLLVLGSAGFFFGLALLPLRPRTVSSRPVPVSRL